jgi:hypothetical protein
MAEEKTCVVCGMSSHRTDWVNKSGNYVACDNHTPDEFTAAMNAAKAPAKSPTPISLQDAAKAAAQKKT